MSQILLGECHPESHTLDGGDVFYQRLHLFMVHQVHLSGTDPGEVKRLVKRQRFGLDPLTVLVIFSPGGYLSNVDFRVKIGGKRMTVFSGVAVHNIHKKDFIKMAFLRMGAKDICNPRVKSAAEQRHDPFFFKPVLIIPLPLIAEFCLVPRFVICGIKIIHTCFQAGIHNGKILIGQCNIDN